MLTDIQKQGINLRLAIILFIAVALRLSGLTAFSLSNDELSALSRLQFESFADVISQGVIPDFHPAGVQIFLYLWTSIFGFGEFAVRFPFAVMGIVSVYLIYKLGRLWFGEGTGLLAAAALAVLEYPLLYSQIARPYSPGLMLTLFAAFYWTKSLFLNTDSRSVNWKDFLLFSVFVSLCMYTHYFSFIFAGILCFSGLLFLRKTTILPYLLSGVIIVLLYLPHLSILIEQLSRGGIGGPDGWLGPPENDAFAKYLDYIFNDSSGLKTLFFVIFTGTFLVYRKELKWTRFHYLSLGFFIVPFLIAYYYSIYVNPVFQFSVLIFSVPYLLLFLFSMVPASVTGFTITFLLAVLLTGGAHSTVKEKDYYAQQHFTEFRMIAKKTIELDHLLGAENITHTVSVFSPYYVNYYHQRYGHDVAYETTRIISEEEKRDFYKIISDSDKPWFLYSFSNVYDAPEIDRAIRLSFPYLAEKDSMMGSGLRLYSRNPIDSALNRLPVYSYSYGFENGEWSNESKFHDTSIVFKGRYSIKILPEIEFGPGLINKLYEVKSVNAVRLEIRSMFLATQNLTGAKIVVSVDHNGKNLFWQAADAGSFHRGDSDWFSVFMTADLPQNLTGEESLNIYFWNEKKESFSVDDFTLYIYLR